MTRPMEERFDPAVRSVLDSMRRVGRAATAGELVDDLERSGDPSAQALRHDGSRMQEIVDQLVQNGLAGSTAGRYTLTPLGRLRAEQHLRDQEEA